MTDPHVIVTFAIGEASFSRCTMDLFQNAGYLTVTSLEDGHVVRELAPGEWVHATCYDRVGHPDFWFHAPTETTQAESNAAHLAELHTICAWCQAVLTEGRPGALTSHGICAECARRVQARVK